MFVPPEKFGHVQGEDEYAGFEARVRLAPIPLMVSLTFQARLASEDTSEMVDAIRDFGDTMLVEWNIDAPADGDSLLQQDLSLVMALVKGWSEALAQPPLASDVPLVNGRTSGQGRNRRNGRTPSLSTASVSGGAARPQQSSKKTPH